MMSKKTNISIRKLSASMFFAPGLIGLAGEANAMMLDLTPDFPNRTQTKYALYMPSNRNQTTRSWTDPRYFLTTFVMPFGVLVWVGMSLLFVYTPYMVYFTAKGVGVIEYKKIELVVVAVIGALTSLYYTIGGFQMFFLELRERFIAHKAIYRDGVFTLNGYFFKKATFHANEVEKVEPIVVSERWFQKRLGTLLSRSTKFTIPNGKNINLKISLHDGRVFYLPGEMGRPGQWKNEDVKELRDFMESCVGSVN
jgi:hypothetical protein